MPREKWFQTARIYHIYPLGFTGAPEKNDYASQPVERMNLMKEQMDHILSMGLNTIYFGPVFESVSHGYDTVDYTRIDRRLGTNEGFRQLVDDFHTRGIRVVLDGVFNHVGRDFGPFRNLREKRESSPYAQWFKGLDFSEDNVFGDGFSYEGWEGHLELVSLDLTNKDVKSYLLNCISWMIKYLDIDGFRLDVAYLLDRNFITELSSHCRSLKEDFWLMGEIIHGDYNEIVRPDGLDSATNYECYKGLYSSHNDSNLFEISWSLNRQFGSSGIYKNLLLYNFLDNHDVDRIASILKNKNHLSTLYALLFMMPGIPSVYYGSEWKYEGKRTGFDDKALRPCIERIHREDSSLVDQIRLYSRIREEHASFSRGDFRLLLTESEQLLFERSFQEETCLFAINICDSQAVLEQTFYNAMVNIFDEKDYITRGSSFGILPYGWKIYKRLG